MGKVPLNPGPAYQYVTDVLKTECGTSRTDKRLVFQAHKFPNMLLTFIFCMPVLRC